jgi:hypothetical protein
MIDDHGPLLKLRKACRSLFSLFISFSSRSRRLDGGDQEQVFATSVRQALSMVYAAFS